MHQLPSPSRDHQNSCLDGHLVWPTKAVLIFLPLGLSHLESLPFAKFSNRIRWRRDRGNCKALCGWVTLDWGLWVERTETNVNWYFRQCWCKEQKTQPCGRVAALRDALGNADTTHSFLLGFQSGELLLWAPPPCPFFTLDCVLLPSARMEGKAGLLPASAGPPRGSELQKATPAKPSLVIHFITWICASPRHLTGWHTTLSLAAWFTKLLGGCLTALAQPMCMRQCLRGREQHTPSHKNNNMRHPLTDWIWFCKICPDLWLKPYRDVMKPEFQVEWSYIMFCSDW